jgi:hypothetical protein
MSTENTKELQRKLVANGYNVTIDGKYGPQTKKAEAEYNNSLNVTSIKNKEVQSKNTLLVKEILLFANGCVGQIEISGNMGFKTPWFYKMMTGVGFQKTHPWCCYFSELCWREGYKKAIQDKPEIDNILHNLFSASVIKTRNNFVNSGSKYGFKFSQTPTPGALIIWQSGSNKAFGHIGIVEKVVGKKIHTIEGNTDSGGSREGIAVAKKVRDLNFTTKDSGLNLIGFIELSDFSNNVA